MNVDKAFFKRKSLSNADLERLIAGLRDEVTRYEGVIANYPEDRMVKYGRPYLEYLRDRVAQAEQTMAERK